MNSPVMRYPDADCWPDPAQRHLLHACLLNGEPAQEAWRRWQTAVDFEQADEGSYRLYPLLYRNLTDQGVAPDRILARCKGVYRLTWSQNNFLFRHCSSLLSALDDAGIDWMLLKGAPLALLFYGETGVRPMSDLDVMVPPDARDSAIELLLQQGYRPLEPLQPRRLQITHSLGFKDDAGFSIDLHWYLMQEDCNPAEQAEWWRRKRTFAFNGMQAHTLSDTDQLFHTIAHGGRWNPMPPLRWLADASVILRRADIDWALLLEHATRLQLVVTLRECLGFMSQLLPGSVPEHVLNALAATPTTRSAEREFRIKANAFSAGKRILFHWYNYQRTVASLQSGQRPGFARYLLLRWDLDNLWEVGGVVSARLRRERSRKRSGPGQSDHAR